MKNNINVTFNAKWKNTSSYVGVFEFELTNNSGEALINPEITIDFGENSYIEYNDGLMFSPSYGSLIGYLEEPNIAVNETVTFSVIANDSCGMAPTAYWVNGLNAINSNASVDTDERTAPTNLKFSNIGADSFTLSWDASTGDVDYYAVAYYATEDGTESALQIETEETQATVTNLMPSTPYTVGVAAVNVSDYWWSSLVEASVTTTAQAPDSTPPTAPENLKSTNASVSSISLSWDAATDNVGVDHYVLSYQPVGDAKAALEIQTTITSVILSNLTAETNYAITLVAVDAAGNQSPATLTTVETAKPSDDTSAPSVPNGLSVSAVTNTSLTLTWKASTDNVGVTGYRVKYTSANGSSVTKDVATTTCVLNSLAANTKYDCCVAAYDANNNVSGYSAIITATTQAQVPVTTTTSFAPYIDVTINANWATNPPGINTKLISDAISKGVKKFHLAFLVQDQASKQLVWGNTYFPYSAVKPVCDIIHAAGGEPIAAFGGASGTDPSVTRTQADLTNIYLNLKKDFGIQHIDFDFETAGQYNYKVAFPAALAAQKQDPTLWFSLTLPVMPTGLTGEGIAMITYAKQIGLALNVQIMAMDYGASGLDMGASAVSAIDATKNNLARIYTDKSSADLYKMIGVIPMIGQNDTAGEMFSFADATKTALYAKQQKLNLVSMWSLGRDFPGSGDLSTCTQNPAQTKDYEYTTTFLNALADDSESDPDKGNVFHVEQHGDPYALNDLQRRQSVPAPIQSTGYWAKAGDVLTVEYVLSGNTPTDAPQIWIHCIVEGSDPAQEYYNDKQKVPLATGVNKINVAKTGVVYIASNNIPDPAVNMQITIVSGGNLMPTFVLGRDDTNAKQWLKDVAQVVRNNTSPYVELVGKRMIITLPIHECKNNVSDPVAILNSWDRIIDWAETQYGLTQNGPYPNIATAVRYHFFTKADSTGGYMSSANEWMATSQDGIKDITDNINSSWGPWHELGHQYEVLAFQTKSEVLENLTSLYVQRELGLTSRLLTDKYWESTRDYLKQSGNNYDAESDLWISVAMFWQLDLTFGKDFYQRLTDNIRMMPVSELPDDNEEKKSLFINLANKVSGFNLSPFFEQWGYRSSVHATSSTKNIKLKKLNDAIWLNEDEKVLYHYPLDQQSISGRLSLPLTVNIGEEFTAQVIITNRQATELSYNWLVPEGFELISSNGATATFRTPAACIANAYASVTCAVSDTENTMNIGAKIQLKSSGEQRRPEAIYCDVILKRYGKDKLQTWDENNPTGTPGDIYLYHSGASYRFFQLRNSNYWYFPTTKSSNSDWTYIGEYNTDIYLTSK